MKKRILATLLATMMTVSCFTACSSSSDDDTSTDDTSTDTSADDDSSEDTDVEVESEDPTPLTIAVQVVSTIEDRETNYFTGLLEEGMNVDLTFEYYPADSSDLDSKVALVVSAGTTLPDIFCFTMTSSEVYEYGSKGAILAMNEYFEDEESTPYFNNLEEDVQSMMINMATVADGNVYSMPTYHGQTWNEGCYRMFVYTPWLETLDAEIPTTTDEFYDLCVRMATEDPNENGLNDEIAIMGSVSGWGQDVTTWIMNAFVYCCPDTNYFTVTDGVVGTAYTTDEYYDGIVYMKMLVDEGLLDPLTFTQDQTSYKAVLGSVDTGAVGFMAAGSYNVFSSQETTDWNVELISPLEGPDGLVSAAQNPTVTSNNWMITKDCTNIEAAVALGDYFYLEEIGISVRFGEEGVEWSMDPEITSLYMSENYESLGTETYLAVMSDLWGEVNNQFWNGSTPCYRSAESMNGIGYYLWEEVETIDQTNSDPNLLPNYWAYYVPAFPDETVSVLSYTDEETDAITIAKTSIDSYIEEQLVGFILGSRDLSEWETYLSELDSMGLEVYLEATQSAYDRTVN